MADWSCSGHRRLERLARRPKHEVIVLVIRRRESYLIVRAIARMIILELVVVLCLDLVALVVDVVDIIVLLVVIIAILGLIGFVLFFLQLDFFFAFFCQLTDCKFLLEGIVDGKTTCSRVLVMANPIVLLRLVTGEFV